MEFSEAVPLVELGLRGLRNSSTRQELDQRREAAKKEASHLEDERGKGDTWGESKRRFAALAQAYSLFPGQEEQVRSLLARAASLPRGFSGFMYTAWLNLAEAVRVCRQESRVAIEPLLAEALSAAHHIQDATFCARATARVNAIQRHWSSLPAGPALSSLVRDFASEPDPRKYSAQHQLREQYSKRAAPPENIPLPSKLLGANTLTEVASAFGLSVSDFLQANAQFGWQAHTSLPNYAWINVPDSDFIPLIATHCSAAVVADTLLSSEEKRALLQLLVPSAAADSSALDTVLARLYLVAAPTEEAALNMV